jgi:hypothetical protein
MRPVIEAPPVLAGGSMMIDPGSSPRCNWNDSRSRFGRVTGITVGRKAGEWARFIAENVDW